MKSLGWLTAALLAVTTSAPAAQEAGRITRIEFRPATVQEGGGVLITLVGSGSCTYTIAFGDGQSERRTATLPDHLHHAYGADGEYEIVATPEAPCEGTARAKLDVRAVERGVWSLSAEPGTAMPDGIEVAITVNGRGACVVTLELGDGTTEKLDATLPARHVHKYAKAGTYELRAITAPPCRGEATMRLEVSRVNSRR